MYVAQVVQPQVNSDSTIAQVEQITPFTWSGTGGPATLEHVASCIVGREAHCSTRFEGRIVSLARGVQFGMIVQFGTSLSSLAQSLIISLCFDPVDCHEYPGAIYRTEVCTEVCAGGGIHGEVEVKDWWLQLLVGGDDKELVVMGEVDEVLLGGGEGEEDMRILERSGRFRREEVIEYEKDERSVVGIDRDKGAEKGEAGRISCDNPRISVKSSSIFVVVDLNFKRCLAWMSLLDLCEVYLPVPVMAISVISISSDSSEDSVGTPTGRVILFGTIPTTIPDTTPVITLPATV
ncbi:hypothetical protein Tco_1370055 [Tanacetum coccineum]